MHVVKIGGSIIDDEAKLKRVLDDLAASNEPFVLVHGGGRQATTLAAALGVEQRMVDGRRITDEETLRITTMVYAGWINKSIVAKLQARGVDAIGICGADGNAIRAHKRTRTEIDYGFVGDVDAVNADMFTSRRSIVVAPITHDGNGTLLNTNADTIAAEIALALAPNVKLTFAFELPGVMLDISDTNSVVETLTGEQVRELSANGTIDKGMLPKINAALRAADGGVESVRIARFDAIQTNAGTVIQSSAHA